MEDRALGPSMSNDPPTLVIEGITIEGMVFRPSDWIERLIGTLSAYGADRRINERTFAGAERRLRQENFLRAHMLDGSKCLVVDTRLNETNPAAYNFLLEFVHSNRLRTQTVRTGVALDALLSTGI